MLFHDIVPRLPHWFAEPSPGSRGRPLTFSEMADALDPGMAEWALSGSLTQEARDRSQLDLLAEIVPRLRWKRVSGSTVMRV